MGILTYFFKICLRVKCYSKHFKMANIMVFKKPIKNKLIIKVCYPIALLSILNKVLKMIITIQSSNLAKEYSLLPNK